MTRLLASILITVLCSLGGASGAAAQDLVITNARIIVGTGATIERGSIVIRNGRTVSVTAGAPTAPAGQTIDAKGMTALPGFIDAHRHVIGGNDERWFKEQSVARMQEFLDAGYTTLMSGGGRVPGIIELKRRVDSGALKGPRIITSG
jgi:imidazolonepropionase-like amidohydrolase